nr:bifunctional diaminohydroxyphosphoribosylaminopyrimidine deaminase/5-amino-6-(5-phosphoribosylamino)uracil reductase RibD [Flavihumibacter rivuli]
MWRCLQLAKLGEGLVAPNPIVGAVLVHEGRIIGEGYHREYGKAHAEVNCLNAVLPEDRHLIPSSTLYVSLEPCAHFGKTPPCADLVIREQIPRVVVGCRDPFEAVNGKGIEKLKAAGLEVIAGFLERECIAANARFFTFHQKKRPYIILKWAQSRDGCIAGPGKTRVNISNELTNRLVHRWRAEESAIMVASNTVQADNPSLTVRHWKGKHPVRILLDKKLAVKESFAIFSGEAPTIVYHEQENALPAYGERVLLQPGSGIIGQILADQYQRGIQSILVEGGTILLQSFLDAGLWDEARVITNLGLVLPGGYPGPRLTPEAQLFSEQVLMKDQIQVFLHKNQADN